MPAFPVYRKLPNLKSHYKILSASEFDEIQQVGTLYFRTTTNAVKYPEILRLQDMISCSPPFEPSSAEDFNSRLEKL
ncbi:MAG: hypothetical protein QNL43_01765 [Crocinitomicaceae bacterium]|jgi:hypothetical protein|tara:strand:- start:22091 stop:22321 length:231 start_codon:yes stop_codon:yes gene_type:complete